MTTARSGCCLLSTCASLRRRASPTILSPVTGLGGPQALCVEPAQIPRSLASRRRQAAALGQLVDGPLRAAWLVRAKLIHHASSLAVLSCSLVCIGSSRSLACSQGKCSQPAARADSPSARRAARPPAAHARRRACSRLPPPVAHPVGRGRRAARLRRRAQTALMSCKIASPAQLVLLRLRRCCLRSAASSATTGPAG